MKPPFPSWSRLVRAVHLPIAKLFVRQCLFFQSSEKINWLLGAVGWLSFLMLVYALFNLMVMEV